MTSDSAALTHSPRLGPEPALPGSALVQRPRLIRKLAESSTTVVLLTAPSGYGKSVLLEQWAAADPRPFLSVLLGGEHNDPSLLVASIVEALEQVEPLAADVSAALANPFPSIETVVLPRLARALGAREVPIVLVLDDLERIESPHSLEIVATVATSLARGSQLALATRTEPALPIGRLRAHRRLTELGRGDLMMTKAESGSLLSGLDLEPTAKQLDLLVRHTEGWPAALYLAGLALGEAPDLGKAIARFAGDDRIVVDYLREEFLGSVSRRRLEFLRRASVLDRLSGPLCDAVLGRTGSATVLRDLSRSNTLLTPLDRRDEWFRFHALFQEMLRSELRRVEPEAEAELNLRASEWWAGRGDWDRAIHHAIEAGAPDRAGDLLWKGVPEYMTRGRNATVVGWLEHMGEETVASDPALSLTAAYAEITLGRGPRAERWAAISRGLLGAGVAAIDPTSLELGLALVDASLARDGVAAMSAVAAAAAEVLPEESPWLSMSLFVDGTGLHLRGMREEGRRRLVDGARRGSVGAPSIQALSLSQLALLAMEEDDWRQAELLSSQARAQIDRSGLVEAPLMAMPLAVSALVRAHSGLVEKAAADLRLGTGLLGELEEFSPWYEVETRIALARAALRLGDAILAKGLLEEASRLVALVPDAVVLGEWIEAVAAAIELVSAADVQGLSPAELRVLQFLPTHLSFPQIAAQLYVSPNTVKTQAQALYRKLGVGSRRQAVERARRAGLLDRDESPA